MFLARIQLMQFDERGVLMKLAYIALVGVMLFSHSMISADNFYDDFVRASQARKDSNFKPIYYQLPKVGVQNDGWSCGINSGTKFLRYHGVATTYTELKAIRKRDMTTNGTEIPKVLQFLDNSNVLGLALNHMHKLGTPPRVLRGLINNQFERFKSKKRVQIFWDQSMTDLRAHLEKGPVIILIEPREPYLHWIMVNGYDSSTNIFTISETSDIEYKYPEYNLKKKWLKWDGMLDWLPGLGLKEGTLITLNK